MSRDPAALDRHPAPAADRISSGMAAFLLFTGPLAWFAQFCVGVVLTSWPCFPSEERRAIPITGYGWTGWAAVLILAGCSVLAALSGYLSWRKLQEVRDEKEGGHGTLAEIGHGRTRFIALWGTLLGVSFAAATLVTLVAFAMVPRCVG